MDLLIVKLRLSLHNVFFLNVCVYCFRCAIISYWFGCLLSLLLTASLEYWILHPQLFFVVFGSNFSKLISVDSCVLHQYRRQPLVIVVRSYTIV